MSSFMRSFARKNRSNRSGEEGTKPANFRDLSSRLPLPVIICTAHGNFVSKMYLHFTKVIIVDIKIL